MEVKANFHGNCDELPWKIKQTSMEVFRYYHEKCVRVTRNIG